MMQCIRMDGRSIDVYKRQVLANHFIMIMSVVMVGMSYQMPVSVGVIQGGGAVSYTHLDVYKRQVIIL